MLGPAGKVLRLYRSQHVHALIAAFFSGIKVNAITGCPPAVRGSPKAAQTELELAGSPAVFRRSTSGFITTIFPCRSSSWEMGMQPSAVMGRSSMPCMRGLLSSMWVFCACSAILWPNSSTISGKSSLAITSLYSANNAFCRQKAHIYFMPVSSCGFSPRTTSRSPICTAWMTS